MDIHTLVEVKKLIEGRLNAVAGYPCPADCSPDYNCVESQTLIEVIQMIDFEIYKEDKAIDEYFERMNNETQAAY